MTRVIAHRGSSGHRPENTAPAFELAIEHDADMIETDLHTTRDGVIVLVHDAELEHLGGQGEVATSSLEEIEALDAGGGARVPRLDRTLDAFGPRIPWNLEIKKPTRGFYEGIEAEALAAVSSRGLLGETLFSSFYDPVLARLRAHSAAARLALLISERFPEGAVSRALELGAEAVNPQAAVTNPELVQAAHAEGLAVYVFTVDDPGEMRRFLEMGVDGLFTNWPDRLRQIIREEY
jgi:glycerophosphoryl diester phosphodiesterase